MIEVSVTQIIIGVAVAILANILVWAFVFGRTLGQINVKQKVQSERIDALEERHNSDMIGMHKELSSVHISVIPECQRTFTELRTGLAKVGGQVNTVISILKEIRNGKGEC